MYWYTGASYTEDNPVSRHEDLIAEWLRQAQGIRHQCVREVVMVAICTPTDDARIRQYNAARGADEHPLDHAHRVVRGLKVIERAEVHRKMARQRPCAEPWGRIIKLRKRGGK